MTTFRIMRAVGGKVMELIGGIDNSSEVLKIYPAMICGSGGDVWVEVRMNPNSGWQFVDNQDFTARLHHMVQRSRGL